MPGSSAREVVSRLARSFDEQDADLVAGDPLGFPGYREQIERAKAETGLSEACVWGWADIDGAPCALVVGDFSFLGGSMGIAVGEKVARGFDAARRARAPVVTVTASGGARMQEGMAALVQMAKVAEARRQHAAAGLGHVTLLTPPTTGGVYASFASLADVVLAEPEATVGFAGPRVVAEILGSDPPARMHTAEFALEHGLVDALVLPADQTSTIGRILSSFGSKTGAQLRAPARSQLIGGVPRASRAAPPEPPAAWERVQIAREQSRPKAPQIAAVLLESSFELHGDRTGTPDDESVIVRVGGVRGTDLNAMLIGQDASGDGRIRPQGFRKAIRGIELAGRLGLPVVTLIDTRGADPLPSSEGHGIAAAVARTFLAMLDCPSPMLAVVVGEGGSGGALAMTVADRVLAWENSVFTVIAPEGAATILYRDAARAAEIAEQLGITADDLVALGIADATVAEPPGGAHREPALATEDLADTISSELVELVKVRRATRLRRRHRRWRGVTERYIEQA
ncbi:MAG: carboxyl transferase domain-containing protein [Actinomycetota bacterium]